MSEYLERTLASKPTFGDYVTLEMKCYGVPNEHFIHEVLSSPFISNSWREVPIKAGYFEEQLHDTSETVIAVRTQGINSRDAHIFAVRLADVLPMKGTNWSWRESPLRSRIADLEHDLTNKEIEYTDLWDDALAFQSRIAELEAENAGLKERVAMLDITAVFKSLGEMGYIEQTNKLHTRIAELEAAQRWIPVSEPPVEGQYCAIMQLDKYGQVVEQGFAIYYGERYDYTMEVWKNITHWYPVPNWNAIELREVQE